MEFSGGQPAESVTLTFAHDGHGSDRALFDAAGAIATVAGVHQLFSYDAYGNAVGFTPTQAATTLLYSGEQFDQRAQMQYLRARYYDANSGRFVGLDPFAGNAQDPQSNNKYQYTHGDPVNATDPTGRESLSSMQIGLGIGISVASLSVSAVQAGYRHGWNAIGTSAFFWDVGINTAMWAMALTSPAHGALSFGLMGLWTVAQLMMSSQPRVAGPSISLRSAPEMSSAADVGLTASRLLLDLALTVVLRRGAANVVSQALPNALPNRSQHERLAGLLYKRAVALRQQNPGLLRNHETNQDNFTEALAAARYEWATGRELQHSTVDGADFVEVLSGLKIQIKKGPLGVEGKTGVVMPIQDTWVPGFARSIIKDATLKVGASDVLVVDLMGLTPAQKEFVISEVAARIADFRKPARFME